MQKIEKDILKKLLLYPKKKVYSNLPTNSLLEKFEDEKLVVNVNKIQRNLYDRDTYLLYIGYHFCIPRAERIFGQHGCSGELIKEMKHKGIYAKIEQVSSSLENFLSVKCFQEMEYAGTAQLYTLERGYLTTEAAFYNLPLGGKKVSV